MVTISSSKISTYKLLILGHFFLYKEKLNFTVSIIYMYSLCGYQNLFLEVYYIPINVISLDTFDFKECDAMLRITTLIFLNPYHPSLKLRK